MGVWEARCLRPGTGLRGLLSSPSHHETPLATDRAPEPAGLAVCKLCSLKEGHPEPGILMWFLALAQSRCPEGEAPGRHGLLFVTRDTARLHSPLTAPL